MLRSRSIMTCAARFLAGALLVVLPIPVALAVPTIDLSLNLIYANPMSANSGGTFEVVAKTSPADNVGLAGLRVLLSGVNLQSIVSTAPRGKVNGSIDAGMWLFTKNENEEFGFIDIGLGQAPRFPDTTLPQEQNVFYGIGTLTNGAPNYPAKPVGSNSIGPAFATLTNVANVPWAATNTFNKPEWVTAAKLVTGTFAVGSHPAFFSSVDDASRGTVF